MSTELENNNVDAGNAEVETVENDGTGLQSYEEPTINQVGGDQQNGEGEGDGDSGDSKPAEAKDEPKLKPWEERRIARFTHKQRETERQLKEAREESENLRKALAHARGEADQDPQPRTEAQIRQEVQRQADQQRQQGEFNAVCNDMASKVEAAAGSQRYVIDATNRLVMMAGMDFTRPEHQQVIRDIAALPNAADVYLALSNNPDAASELFDASPREQLAILRDFNREHVLGRQQQRQAPAQTTQQAISRAPAPVTNISQGSRSPAAKTSIYDRNISAEEYAKLRAQR